MKKPLFKFELDIYKPITVNEHKAYNSNGELVTDNDSFSTNIIEEPGFVLPKYYIGKHVIVTNFAKIADQVFVVSSQVDYQIFTDAHNIFDFTNDLEAIAFTFSESTLSSQDTENFLLYTYKVNPDFSKLSKNWSRGLDEMYMRCTLQGNLKFKNDVFDLIASLPVTRKLRLNISKLMDEDYELYYRTAIFTKVDCQLDYDRKLVTPSFKPDDAYNDIIAALNTEYDVKKLGVKRSKTFYKIPPMTQIYASGAKTITNIIGCSYFTQDVELPDLEEGQTEEQMLESYGFGRVNNTVEYDLHFAGSGQIEQFYYTADGRILGNSHLYFNAYGSDESLYYIEMESWWTVDDNRQSIIFRLKLKSDDSVVAYSDVVRVDNFGSASIAATQLKTQSNVVFAYIGIPIRIFIYERLLAKIDGDLLPNTLTGFLAEDDFAYSGQVYNAYRMLETRYVGEVYTFDQYHIPYKVSASVSTNKGEFALIKEGIYYFTNRDVQLEADERPIPICYDAWAGISFWATPSISLDTQTLNTYGYSFVNNDTVTLFDLIRSLLSKVAPNVILYDDTRSSTFFFGNQLNLSMVMPVFTHLSNIQAGAFNNSAKMLKVKLADIFTTLKNTFRCYWFIDSGNVMHIEHIGWFLNNIPSMSGRVRYLFDLTDLKDVWNKQPIHTGQNTIQYSHNGLFKQLIISSDDDTTDAFDKKEISISDAYLENDDINEIQISEYKTNIDHIFATASSRDDGVVMLICKKQDNQSYDYYVPRIEYTDADMLTDANTQYTFIPSNTYALARYVPNYYMYDFYGTKLDTTAYDVKHIKWFRHLELTFPVDEDIKYSRMLDSAFVLTNYGKALLEKLDIDFDTQYAKLEVLLNDTDYMPEYNFSPKNSYTELYDFVSPQGTVILYDTDINRLSLHDLLSLNDSEILIDMAFNAKNLEDYKNRLVFSSVDDYAADSEKSFFGILVDKINGILAPYKEDFENITTQTTGLDNIRPEGWKFLPETPDAVFPHLYYGGGYQASGNYSLYLSGKGIYAMPKIKNVTNMNSLTLSLYVAQCKYAARLDVGVLADIEDVSSFKVVQTVNLTTYNTPVYSEINFKEYEGKDGYIAFRNYTTNTDKYSQNWLDNIDVKSSESSKFYSKPFAVGAITTVNGQYEYDNKRCAVSEINANADVCARLKIKHVIANGSDRYYVDAYVSSANLQNYAEQKHVYFDILSSEMRDSALLMTLPESIPVLIKSVKLIKY